MYKKFRQKFESKSLLVVNEDKWNFLNQRWNYVAQKVKTHQTDRTTMYMSYKRVYIEDVLVQYSFDAISKLFGMLQPGI